MKLSASLLLLLTLAYPVFAAATCSARSGYTSEEATMPDGSTSTLYIRDDFVPVSPNPGAEQGTIGTKLRIVHGNDQHCAIAIPSTIHRAAWIPRRRFLAMRCPGARSSPTASMVPGKAWDWRMAFIVQQSDSPTYVTCIGNLDIAGAISFAINPANELPQGSTVRAAVLFNCSALESPKITWTLGATHWPVADTGPEAAERN
ncbi:hypothetical protein BJ170DRAFT_680095 [Xylariales sp. AK1849]|nr:hypothetical protein BJ170DRAFT_680095 [Xylariales sp. AK1849]